MKKIPWDYVILFFQMTFVGILILYIYSSYIDAYNTDFLDRSMYSGNVMGIQLSNGYLASLGETVDLDMDDILTDGDYAVYRYLSYDVGEIVRGIYETGDIFDFSDYIETGRFFDRDDFTAASKTAVIGQKVWSLTYEEDGRRYYGHDGKLYEVIGVFRETDSDLDRIVYLNLNAILSDENDMGLYYVDSRDAGTVENVIQSIEANAEGSYTTSRVEYESPQIKVGMHKMTGLFAYCAVFASVLYMVITLIYFMAGKEYTVAIQKLCGMTKKDRMVEYGMKMSITVSVSFVLICILEKTIADRFLFFAADYLGWQHFVLLAVTFTVVDAISTVGVVTRMERVDISGTLKGR